MIHRLFIGIALAVIGSSLATVARPLESANGLEPSRQDVIYGRADDAALTLDVFSPASNANGAAVIHLANGGWHRAHDDPHFFAELLKRGYVVLRVVTSSEPKYTMLEQMPQVSRAIRFARAHAGEFGFDPNRIGIEGASSGGHLALLAAMAADDGNPNALDPVDRLSSRVKAAAVFFPATDFLNYGKAGLVQDGTVGPLAHHHPSFDFAKFDEASRTMVKITDRNEQLALLKKVSPISYVSANSPPTFIVHGDRDDVIPLQQSQSMIAALKAVGVEAKLDVQKDGGHGWDNFWLTDGVKLADWFDARLK